MSPEVDSQSWLRLIASGLGTVTFAACLALWRVISSKASKVDLAAAVETMERQHALMLERIDEHYEESKESRERLFDKFDEINKGLGATMVALSRLQGRLDQDDAR
jgi:hypothetical protein